jgi:hypothetical protein
VIADTSDLHALGAAQLRHADQLSSIAADLTAAIVAADAFGPVGARFLTALNQALTHEASLAAQLAERLAAGKSITIAAANSYQVTEGHVGQAISRTRT